ncbi:MAG: methyltransferase domain-containing protein [Acidobacteria bacterium]|nr:methyltransferase domain-containing protein [Acidobacteriota bacterium]
MRFLCASAEEIPWQENFFSQALAVESLFYFENLEKALREIGRVMSPGGFGCGLGPPLQRKPTLPSLVGTFESAGAVAERRGVWKLAGALWLPRIHLPTDSRPHPAQRGLSKSIVLRSSGTAAFSGMGRPAFLRPEAAAIVGRE